MFLNKSFKALFNLTSGTDETERLRVTDDYLLGLMQTMGILFEGEQFCDVTLISNDECKVKAHKIVLCGASEYFLRMFDSSFLEADADMVKLHQAKGVSLQMILSFIYTGSIQLSTDTVQDILEASQIFQLNALVQLCCDYIEKQLDPSNCLGIALLAHYLNCTKLYETSKTYIFEHFMLLRQCQEFLNLKAEQLCEIISSYELCVPSEEEVFHSIMLWIKHNRTEREQFIWKLFNCIRFPFLLPKFIASIMEPACTSIEIELLIYKAYKWHFMPEFRLSLFSEEQTKLRKFKNMIVAVRGWDNPDGILNVGYLIPSLNEWTYKQCPAPTVRRTDFGSTILNGKLIIAGGKLCSGEVTNNVQCLDLSTLKWTELYPMEMKRHSFEMVTLNGEVYALGGQNITGELDTMEKWNGTATGKWQYVASLPSRNGSLLRAAVRFNSLCVAHRIHQQWPRDRRYVNSEFIEHVIYDPDTNTWSEKWLTTDGQFLGMGTVRVLSTDYFIIVSKKSTTRYNLSLNTVATIQNNANNWNCTNCAVVGGCMIAFGPNEFQEYNAFENKWKDLPRLTSDQGKVVLISF